MKVTALDPDDARFPASREPDGPDAGVTEHIVIRRPAAKLGRVDGRRPDVLARGATRMRLQHEVDVRVGRGYDTLPDLFFTEPVRAGTYAGAVLDRPSFAAEAAEPRRHLGLAPAG